MTALDQQNHIAGAKNAAFEIPLLRVKEVERGASLCG